MTNRQTQKVLLSPKEWRKVGVRIIGTSWTGCDRRCDVVSCQWHDLMLALTIQSESQMRYQHDSHTHAVDCIYIVNAKLKQTLAELSLLSGQLWHGRERALPILRRIDLHLVCTSSAAIWGLPFAWLMCIAHCRILLWCDLIFCVSHSVSPSSNSPRTEHLFCLSLNNGFRWWWWWCSTVPCINIM